jgi:hypothetical protein
MLTQIAKYQEGTEAGYFDKPWTGTFRGNSWTDSWIDVERTCYKLGRLGNARTIKAHLGHTPEIERFLYLLGAVHIFMYRDLRDVAVSQAHHIIESDDEGLNHPDKEAYPIEDYNEVLKLVITGTGRFPGVVDRWKLFAPWLDVDWTLSVKFEDVIADKSYWAERMFKHGLEYNASKWGHGIKYVEGGADYLIWRMVQASDGKYSPTFRKGVSGGWKDTFTDEHINLWKEHDSEQWLCRLGYEESGWYSSTG